MIDQPGEAKAEGNALRDIGREEVLSECSDLSQEMGCFRVKNADKKTEVKLEIV